MTDQFKGLPCDRTDCSLSTREDIGVTLAYYPQIYNRAGERTDQGDMNTTTAVWNCSTCQRRFPRSTRAGISKWSVQP